MNTGKTNIARLSPRQRDCLALVAEHRSSKEIGEALGLSSKTVDGYLAEAVQWLGARNRRHAAQIYVAQAQAGNAADIPDFPVLSALTPPEKLPAQSLRVGTDAYVMKGGHGKQDPVLSDHAGAFRYGDDVPDAVVPERSRQGILPGTDFHLLRGGRRSNGLTTRQRLVWMLIAAVAATLLFTNAVLVLGQLAQVARNLTAVTASGQP